MRTRPLTTGLLTITAALAAISPAAHATAAPATLSAATIRTHLDLAKGQLPENIALEPGGAVTVTFAASRQLARIDAKGHVRILATLPAPTAAQGKATPVLHFPLATGLVRTSSGTHYLLYAAGSPTLTGLWRVTGSSAPIRVAALPATGLPNGLALSEDGTTAYAADSVLGVVYRIRLADGAVRTWAKGAALQATGFLGANGVKVHGGAVWVSNLDKGTLLRIPVIRAGGAGPSTVKARHLEGIDDFAFTGQGDTVLAALDQPNRVVLLTPGRQPRTVLTGSDGLQGPTAVAVRGKTIYVPSAAYNTQTDPNLLTAHLQQH